VIDLPKNFEQPMKSANMICNGLPIFAAKISKTKIEALLFKNRRI
jgi:hypothetical protein